ncbi:autophagy-related protein 13-domain-containing protein [Lipomyces arxii]|uniref:autophagy-related protein 13-domain-containing protein n=1 Tax=Lipomyces arxii TaxID=56418 RepID=UPI0034CDBBDB
MNLPATLSGGQDFPATGSSGPGMVISGFSSQDPAQMAKLNQMVQNLYTKAAQVVIQSRVSVPPIYSRGDKKTNKWFNLELDDTDAFRDELRIWKGVDVSMGSISLPPLIIETVLDTRGLTANQMLVLLDDSGKRWNIDAAAAAVGLRADFRRSEIVVERWRIELDSRSLMVGTIAPELPVVYKKAFVLFRSLYAYVRLLPVWRFKRKLSKVKLNPSALNVSCRVLNGAYSISSRDRIGLSMPLILDPEQKNTENYTFQKIETPVGLFSIHVTYRKNCDFKVDDSESILSSHFLNLDEYGTRKHPYLIPTSSRSSASITSRYSGAAHSPPNSLPLERYSPSRVISHTDPGLSYGSLSSFHQQPGTTDSKSSLRGSPRESALTSSLTANSAAAARNLTQQRPGLEHRRSSVQPFKSPALSASPIADSIQSGAGSYPRMSYQRMSSSPSLPADQRDSVSSLAAGVASQRQVSDTPFLSSSGQRASTSPASSVGSRSDRRYSSSFGSRSQWQQGSRSASSSSIAAPVGPNPQVQALLSQPSAPQLFPAASDDDELSDFVRMLDARQPLKSFERSDTTAASNGGVGLGTSAPRTSLSRFKQLRDYHAQLSDSMSASTIVSSQPSSPVQSRVPAGSFSSSVGSGSVKGISPHTPHTPAIPSRLSEGLTAEYRHEPVFEDDDDDDLADEDDGGLGRHVARHPVVARKPGLARHDEQDELGMVDSGGETNSVRSDSASQVVTGHRSDSASSSGVGLRPYSASSRRDVSSGAAAGNGGGGFGKSSPGSTHSREELSHGSTPFVDDDELLFAMSDMVIAIGEKDVSPQH